MECHEEDCQWWDFTWTDCCTWAGNDETFVEECPIRTKPPCGEGAEGIPTFEMVDMESFRKIDEENAALKKRVDELSYDLESMKRNCLTEMERAEQTEARLKKLMEAIGEVLDGTLPYLTEKRLKSALEPKE